MMKAGKRDLNYAILLIITGLTLISSCKKKESSAVILLPELSAVTIKDITENSVSCKAIVTSTGGGQISSVGICWNDSTAPTVANDLTYENYPGDSLFTDTIYDLIPNTTYYLRAFATNESGRAYGSEISFKTLALPTVNDLDGNLYHTVKIGTQLWMVENLKVTKYKDGTAIPKITGNTEWSSLTTPGFCWYNNEEAGFKNTYGALYNWYAVNTSKLCPAGWHVPTDSDWTILTTYLKGLGVAGGKLKETGTIHWTSPNDGASNSTGFTALPGGYRDNTGNFSLNMLNGYWWTNTGNVSSDAWSRIIYFNGSIVHRNNLSKNCGMSVRCIRD
jgi:uncharacterized protein (TIGR02145 family)